MPIDYSTNVGKLRLRVADLSDLPLLPDSVYADVLAEKNGNLKAAATQIAGYILGMLSFRTQRQMAQLIVYGNQAFEQYKQFLIMTTKDPAFMDISPLAYGLSSDTKHPLQQFQEDWNNNTVGISASQQLSLDAIPNGGNASGISPNQI